MPENISQAQKTALENYKKQRVAMRYWLLGAGYYKAAEAMTLAETYHNGFRKDGVMPEFAHQVAIAGYLRTLHTSLRNPERAITVGFVHDIREDYDVPDDSIRLQFGNEVADSTDCMTKEFRGVKRNQTDLFFRIGNDSEASIAKLADRIHNHSSMLGVFTPAKIESYMKETEEYFLPMLKEARRKFPDQDPAYENAKLVLNSQLDMLKAVLEASEKTPA